MDAGDNKPSFLSAVPFGVSGGTSDIGFAEFANDICPKWCPNVKSCKLADYVIICDENNDGTFIEPTLFTATVESDGVDPVSNEPVYSVKMVSVNSLVIENIYQCKV